MSDQETLGFDDLNLNMGQKVQVIPDPSNLRDRHDCILFGCIPGQSVIVSPPPETGAFPNVEEGQKVIIRVMSSNGVALFPSTVLYVSDVPLLMVFLDYPEAIQFKRVRNASRVDVALPVLASNTENRSLSGVAGKIVDISIGGARLELYSDVGDVGEEIELKGKFNVGSIQRILSIKANVASKKPRGDKGLIYGVQFKEADEDKMLILFGFIFSSMAFGNVQTVS